MTGEKLVLKFVWSLGFITCVVGFSQQTAPDLTGTWQLTAASAHRGVDFSATLAITQKGIDISGQITYGGTPCVTNATDSFTGSVLPSVSILVNSSAEKITLSNGTVAQGQVAGVAYSQILGGTYTSKYVKNVVNCNPLSGTSSDGDSGTWTAKQVSTAPPTPPTPSGPALKISAVSNAASGEVAALVPGEIVSIFADSSSDPIGPLVGVGPQLDANGRVSASLAGVQVAFLSLCGTTPCASQPVNAPLTYASARQINAVIPYEVAGASSLTVLVTYQNHASNALAVNTTTAYPRIFTANGSGGGQGAIFNDDGSTLNGPSSPEPRGGTVVLFLTGEGQTLPPGVTGKVTTVSLTPPLTPAPQLPVNVYIDGQASDVVFAGEAPSLVSGVMQVNVRIPATARSGSVPIQVMVGTSMSPPVVTVAVK
jgi:uncharacterized protein (TIGR03437 family)